MLSYALLLQLYTRKNFLVEKVLLQHQHAHLRYRVPFSMNLVDPMILGRYQQKLDLVWTQHL